MRIRQVSDNVAIYSGRRYAQLKAKVAITTRHIKRLRNLHRTSLEKKDHLEQTIQPTSKTTRLSRST